MQFLSNFWGVTEQLTERLPVRNTIGEESLEAFTDTLLKWLAANIGLRGGEMLMTIVV